MRKFTIALGAALALCIAFGAVSQKPALAGPPQVKKEEPKAEKPQAEHKDKDKEKKEERKAEKAGEGVGIGDAAPDFELTAADGKKVKLSDYKDKIVVLEWFNQDCPFCKGAIPRMKAAEARFAPKGVVWLAVDSTNSMTADRDLSFAKEQGIKYPILMDSDGKVGHAYGAARTPHMFVINKGKLAYIGAPNDDQSNKKADAEIRNYIDEALGALVAGKEVPTATTKPWGCTVKYKK